MENIRFDKWIVRVLRSVGGSWEQWEDELTLDRFEALIEAEEDVPPLYVTGYLSAIYLGAMKPPKSSDTAPESGAAFIAAFGSSGSMGAM